MMTKEWTKFVLVFVLGMLCESIITTINTINESRFIVTSDAFMDVLQGVLPYNDSMINQRDLSGNKGIIFAYADPQHNDDFGFMPAPSEDNPDILSENEVELNDFIQAV